MKTWVNGELVDATKMNALEQSVPTQAISLDGFLTFKNGNGTNLFSVATGGNSYLKIGEADITASTTSTSAASVGNVNVTASDLWTSEKIVYVSIRDKAGKRNGYFYGTDTWFANPYPVNAATTSSLTIPARMIYACNASGKWVINPSNYGIYPYGIYSDGRVAIYSRYSSTVSLTINGTYHVDVYLLSWASSTPLT